MGSVKCTGIFLQVRLSSSRLPRKALLPLKGITVIEHAMLSLKQAHADVYALLTDHESGATLKGLASPLGFEVFEGDPDDVLLRYASATEYYGVERVIRATGDNPLVSAILVDEIVKLHEECNADYSGFLGPPLGTCVEVVKASSLLCANSEAQDPYEREHVNPFLYRRPERFVINRPEARDEVSFRDARVTLDTPEDYKYISRIYDDLYVGRPIEAEELVCWLKEEARKKG
ncbi:MAG TPA: acylneuraminate cytidylyltransferase [Spirochaetia bacterium]|nr:acylneuraminate cytidylyltransferase [Spirochaetia bacterium]